jgi:GxxExxY protein
MARPGENDVLTQRVIGFAIDVHRQHKSVRLDCGYRLDVVVQDQVIVELKTVERLAPIHEAQMLTYMRLSGIRTDLLLNFNCAVLKDGIRRLML